MPTKPTDTPEMKDTTDPKKAPATGPKVDEKTGAFLPSKYLVKPGIERVDF